MIIRDYVIKEVLRTFVGVFVVLFLIILSTQLLKALSAVAHGKIALDFLLSLIALKNIESLTLIIPLTLFLSILLALSRLYKDSEMIALSACGIGPSALLRSILWVVCSFIFIEIALAMVLGPWASYKMQYAQESFKSDVALELITAGQFNIANDGQRVLYAEQMPKPTQLENVFLHVENKETESVMASDDAMIETNAKEGTRYIVFKKGNRYDGTPGVLNYRFIQFERYGVLMEGKQLLDFTPVRKSMTSVALWGSEELAYQAELQWRISQILMMLILAIIAVPLSKTAPRHGRYGKMALAILLYIVYSNLLIVAMNWVRKDVVPPSIGMWWVHVLFFTLFIILFLHQLGWLNTFRSKKSKQGNIASEFDDLVDA